jgi:glycosyltransferase involved in cell wall biosynthesis
MNKKIKVCIDIRDLKIAKTGARTFLEEIRNVFSKDTDPRFEFIFIDTFFPVYTGKNKVLKMLEHFRFSIWKQLILPLKAFFKGADIVCCTDYFVPLFKLGYQTIPVFHDAFFWEYPTHYNSLWRWLFLNTGVVAAKRSFAILTPTYYTQKRIAHFSSIPLQKIIPVFEGPKTLLAPEQIPETWKHLSDKKFLLHVGTFEKRKNLTTLIQAFQLLRNKYHQEDLYLVLVGQPTPKVKLDGANEMEDLLMQPSLKDHIICTGYMPDHLLGWFYQHASVYVFPSINEGFGIPVLESFAHDLPVVVADNTSLPEVAGDAALTFTPTDSDQLASQVLKILTDPDLRKDLILKGRNRLSLFSWEKTCNLMKEVFISATNPR